MIHIAIPGVPLSSNHAYFHVTSGKGKKKITKRVLTEAGRKYKTETTSYIVKHYPQELTMFKPNTPYGYIIQIFFPNMLNKGWPETAKTRYKKFDVTNRVKLLEDAIVKAIGIDDCNFLSTRSDKAEGPEYTHIWMWNMEEECPYRVNPG